MGLISPRFINLNIYLKLIAKPLESLVVGAGCVRGWFMPGWGESPSGCSCHSLQPRAEGNDPGWLWNGSAGWDGSTEGAGSLLMGHTAKRWHRNNRESRNIPTGIIDPASGPADTPTISAGVGWELAQAPLTISPVWEQEELGPCWLSQSKEVTQK